MNSLKPIDEYFINLSEPTKSCFEFLRIYILQKNNYLKEEWKYKMPFYYYKGKMFCYLWKSKKENTNYIAFNKGAQLNHPDLISDGRKVFKLFILNTNKDLPLKKIDTIIDQLIKVLET